MASAKIQRMSKSDKQRSRLNRQSKTSDIPEEIQCKICKKRYEDPKLLPCLHTFCKACLEKGLEIHGGVLYCPVCPKEISSSEFSDVDKLLSNFMVSNLLQAIDIKQGLSSKQCESCDEGVSASSRCFECSDFLCENCVEAHKRVRFTKTHRIVAMKNLDADSMVKTSTCATHAQEALKMYCKQCKKPVCRSCIRSEHDEHVLISLKQAVEDTKPKLNTLLIAARAKIPILQRKLKGVHTSKQRLETKVDDVIKEIQATSARVLMAVKRREKDLYKMLRRIHDQKSDELEGKELALENDLAQVLDCCDFAEELGKSGNEAMVLHVSEMTSARLKDLSVKEDEAVLEITEDEIEYRVDEKQVLDELKIYGKVLSKEQKAKQEKKEGEKMKESGGRKNEKGDEKKVKQEEDKKQSTVERRTSWLQTLANPRALMRRLSFGGDEMEDKKPEPSSDKKPEASSDTKDTAVSDEMSTRDNQKAGGQKAQDTQAEVDTRKQQVENKQEDTAEPRKRSESVSKPTTPEKIEEEHIYAVPDKSKSEKAKANHSIDPRKSPPKPPRSFNTPKSSPREHASQTSPSSLNDPNRPQDPSKPSAPNHESPRSHSILKPPSPHDTSDQSEEAELAQAWTVRKGSVPSGAHSQSYLPSLCILTKNRRGRPREVEVELESPDNSIVSAQILDHKNGTYTIFYCPLTPGEHNLYVNIGGKNVKHGKKVLNFYGKFGGMGAEELFLARRALSCIRWQVTPGFVELKDKKLQPNPDI